jgi:hypothetical protein
MAGTGEEFAEQQQCVLLVSRLTESFDAAERERLKEELTRMTFGGSPDRGASPTYEATMK